MAQFTCDTCDQTFEQKSRYERHLQTSHPEQAPSAADMQRLLAGIRFPQDKEGIVRHAHDRGDGDEAIDLLEALPDQEYRDAAEVTRALGAVKSDEEKPGHQPGRLGGRRAVESPQAPSAARIAKAFEGVSLPGSAAELREYADEHTDEEVREIVARLPERTYRDMADIARAFGEVLQAHDSD